MHEQPSFFPVTSEQQSQQRKTQVPTNTRACVPVDDNELPVGFAIVDEHQHAEDLDAHDRAL